MNGAPPGKTRTNNQIDLSVNETVHLKCQYLGDNDITGWTKKVFEHFTHVQKTRQLLFKCK